LAGKACQRLRDEFVGTDSLPYRGYGDFDVMTVASALHTCAETVKRTGLLIIDEASMLGTSDFGKLFCLVKDSAHVVMVGDDAQLMPIDKGYVFTQLGQYAKNHPVPYSVSELGENHRLGRALGSDGVERSLDAMRNGDVDGVWNEFQSGSIHFHGLDGNDDMSLLSDAIAMYKDRVKRCHRDFSKVGLLSTSKTATAGALSGFALNLAAREAINPDNGVAIDLESHNGGGFGLLCERKGTYIGASSAVDDKIMRKGGEDGIASPGYELLNQIVAAPYAAIGKKRPGHVEDLVCVGFRIGDRVMCNVTSIHGTNNGDVGTIVAIKRESNHSFGAGCVAVALDRGPTVDIPLDDLMDEWQLGYAITVHKSQGSEYDDVIFCVPRQRNVNGDFLCRNLVYTAATRLRRRLDVFGDEETVRKSIAMPAAERCTLLEQRMTQKSF
jgi:hypothetical protein